MHVIFTSVFNLIETRVFSKKPNLTRNFKTQTQPKTEFEILTQPKKNRVYFGLFFKEKFSNLSQIFKKKKLTNKSFCGLIFISKILFKLSLQHRAAWSNHGRPLKIFMISGASGTAQNCSATECRS
jgi:hypothetical protein